MMKAPGKPLFHAAEVRRAFSLLTHPEQVVEVRALEATTRTDRYPATYSGYFNRVDPLLHALDTLHAAQGIYMTLQPCLPALLGRANNKLLRQKKSGGSTSDTDITGYAWLPIDSDPERPSHISSSQVEHDAALAHSRLIRDTLRELGWPEPILADSGNGSHLLYRIDLAVAESELVKRVLQGLAEQCAVEGVHVDTTLHNPSRILKLYGTLACKGDDMPARPHRMSRLLEVPQDLQVVPKDLLEAIAVQNVVPASGQQHEQAAPGYDLRAWIEEHQIATYGEEAWQGKTRWKLKTCPFCLETDKGAVLLLFASGAVSFKCHHHRCQGKHWRDFRSHYDPAAYAQPEAVAGPLPPLLGDAEGGPLYGLPDLDRALRARDVHALYDCASQIVLLPDLTQKQVRLDIRSIFGRDFPMREFDDLLHVQEQWHEQRALMETPARSVQELMQKPFQELQWAVPGILPEGLIVLAGKQKIGKSWLDYHLSLVVASGGLAFGTIPVTQGSVLYLALEDSERTMQERWRHLLAPGQEVPACLEYATQWPRMDHYGLRCLEDWMVAHQDARLIIIDPWVLVKPRLKTRAGETGYDADYEGLTGLKHLADTYHLTILVQHHLRKASSEDPFDEVNGTSGITACADGFLSLKRARGQAEATLWGTGRQYKEDVNLALSFTDGIWHLLGDADAHQLSKASKDVLALLHEEGKPLTSGKIAALLEKPRGTIRSLLFSMKKRGEIKETDAGYLPLLTEEGTLLNRAIFPNSPNGGNNANSANTSNEGTRSLLMPEARASTRCQETSLERDASSDHTANGDTTTTDQPDPEQIQQAPGVDAASCWVWQEEDVRPPHEPQQQAVRPVAPLDDDGNQALVEPPLHVPLERPYEPQQQGAVGSVGPVATVGAVAPVVRGGIPCYTVVPEQEVQAYRELWEDLKRELQARRLTREALFWQVPGSGMESGEVQPTEYLLRLIRLGKSNNTIKFHAGKNELLKRLGREELP